MSSERCLGLSLETLACYVCGNREDTVDSQIPARDTIPPAVICSSIEPQEFQLDHWFPASHIGSGEDWPPESKVENGTSRRMPIGLLWDLARREEPWRVESEYHVDPMEAIATAAKDSVHNAGSASSVGLVMPNWLKQAQQQLLLDGLAGTGIKWRLTWLPIAAATYWIEHFFHGRSVQHATRTKLGQILSIHLGLFGCEWAIVELIGEPFEGRTSVIPARQRSSTRSQPRQKFHQPGLMSNLLVQQATQSRSQNGAVAHAWRQMWATPWMQRQLANWRGLEQWEAHDDCPIAYDPPVSFNAVLSSASEANCDGISWPTLDMNVAKKWVDGLFRELELSRQPISGAIISGELASVRSREKTLGEQLLANRIDSKFVLIADESAPRDILAIGAAEQCRRMDAGEPSYLTKLPWLRTVISRVGEPEWISLLADGDPYVMGGQRWVRPEPIRGITIPRGEVLTLAIDHEDLENVRESQIEIPSSYKPNQPAELHVAITPAQGNARIELRTADMPRNRKPVVANLHHMAEVKDDKGNTLDPDAYLKWYPRLSPPLLPRKSSLQRWMQVKTEAQRSLGPNPANWDVNSIRRVKDELRQKVSQQGENITAIGCDGVPPDGDYESLNKIGQGCLQILKTRHMYGDRVDATRRCLAYTSWTSPELESFIAEQLLGGYEVDDAKMRVIGNCLRSPVTIGKFLDNCSQFLNEPGNRFMDNHLAGYLNGHQVRTIAELSSYRADALKHVSGDAVTSIYDAISREFERSTGYAGLHFRYLTMCAAFMLRRRIFDEGFVPIDSVFATRVKQKCQNVVNGIDAGQVQVMGGAVNLRKVMKQLIKYVDRKGRGPFIWAA